jgi:hypothetical protein
MRRRLYRLVVVAGWFGDGDRRGTIGFISVAAWLVSLAPLQETVRAAVGDGDIHCRQPFVEFRAASEDAGSPAPDTKTRTTRVSSGPLMS